jgi:hypothetical protein
MKAGEWEYGWWYMTEEMSVYFRIREEATSDGMPKPYVETLAYMQKQSSTKGKVPGFAWRALLHSPDDVKEMDIPPSIYPMQIMDHIQQHFKELT